jgi:choline dehydrogenase
MTETASNASQRFGAGAFDVIVIGAGSAGCVLAARLSERSSCKLLLLEAGPDYPTLAELPADLADCRNVTDSHDWGYASEADAAGRSIGLPRGRVVGGCSAVNATFAVRGFPSDYDAWAAAGNPGWSFQDVLPFFCKAETDLDFGDAPWHGATGPSPIRRYSPPERSAFSQAFLEASRAASHAAIEDHNRPGALGAGPAAVNALDGIRMNTALTYLAQARGRANVTIRAGVVVERIETHARRAVGVRLSGGELIECGRVVLAAGAYGSPAILLRSGVGLADDLRACGIAPVVALAGVGQNLIDHPLVGLRLPLTGEVGALPRHQMLVTWKSRVAGAEHACDMHLFSSGPHLDPATGRGFGALSFSVMKPSSRGRLRLRSADPLAPPQIRLAHLETASDRARMREGLLEARRVARAAPLAGLVAGDELSPAPGIGDHDGDALDAALRAKVSTYHHPVGTCAMGPSPDRGAVVDARGRVHGLDSVFVADASIMPDIPAANTNLPAIMIAERIAAWLA